MELRAHWVRAVLAGPPAGVLATLRPDAVQKHQEYQHEGVRRLLSGLLASPEKLQEHVR